MRVNNQAEMESCARNFIEHINDKFEGTFCAMLRPSFAACDFDEKTITLSYPGQSWEKNPLGVMQGGVVAAALDYTVGCLAVTLSGDRPVTVSMQISYLAPTPVEGNIIVKARATRAGRTLIHSYAEAWAEDMPGKLLATGNFVYKA